MSFLTPADAQGVWPAHWIDCPDAGPTPFVTAYRLAVPCDQARTVRVHVTADERYVLFLNGERVGRGLERGDAEHWFFETYDLDFLSGDNILTARVWSQGADAPFAQMSVQPGFFLCPADAADGNRLATGKAAWETKRLGGYEFTNPKAAWGTGVNVILHGAEVDWGHERGVGDGWTPARVRDEGVDVRANDRPQSHRLTPAALPPMLDRPWRAGVVRNVSAFSGEETHAIPIRAADDLTDERQSWDAFLRAESPEALTIPPRTRRRILLDLDDYVCAYPEVVTSGGQGSALRIHWQETLFDDPKAERKGNRDEIEGKYFTTIWWVQDGIGDEFRPDGGSERRFETLWWQCGRYVEIVVTTADEPLTLHGLALRETRYPLEQESEFTFSDPRLAEAARPMRRALQTCSHETYMDCPYYEQLQYIGDTRLQVLTTYAITRDDRLPRKAIDLFGASRVFSGLTQSRYPSRVRQMTRLFSLWWITMVHDYALWRDDPAFVRRQMPGVRAVLDGFQEFLNADGLLTLPEGPNLNFIDWVPGWEGGAPPDGGTGINGIANWHYALTLQTAAALEDLSGEPELAARLRRRAQEHAAQTEAAFWDEARGLFSDDLAHQHFSEHAQCLAILSGLLDPIRQARVGESLFADATLARTTIYFTHYLFEAAYALGVGQCILNRMGLWFGLAANGQRTTPEMPEPTRSDCHAWGAHPLYHDFASLLGIRPAAPGFAAVRIAPQLGSLTEATGRMTHPKGEICVQYRVTGERMQAEITLPETVPGVFQWRGQTRALTPGAQTIEL